jgi:hypothetical protein
MDDSITNTKNYPYPNNRHRKEDVNHQHHQLHKQDVHKFLEKNFINQQQSHPTPQRGHPLDEGERSSNNEFNQQQRPRKRFQRSGENGNNKTQQVISRTQQQFITSSPRAQQTTNQMVTQCKRIPFDQLKHAVSSNLPCFHIQWELNAENNNIPSAIQASNLILKELEKNGVEINQFTLFG